MLNAIFLQGLLATFYILQLYLLTSILNIFILSPEWLSGQPDLFYRLVHYLVNNERALKYHQKSTPFCHRKDA